MHRLSIGNWLVAVLLVAVIIATGCVSHSPPETDALLQSDNPAERLRGQIDAHELSTDEAVARLDELRPTFGAEKPAHFHLAAARVNIYENHPQAALDALEYALEADAQVVDDASRLQIAEFALRAELRNRRDDEQFRRTLTHIMDVAPNHPQLTDWTKARLLDARLDESLVDLVPDDQALDEADDICQIALSRPSTRERFIVRCARTAHQQGDDRRARQLIIDWLDDHDGALEQLEAIFEIADDILPTESHRQLVQIHDSEALLWRGDTGRALTDRGRRIVERSTELEHVQIPADTRARLAVYGAQFAYLAQDFAEARRWAGPDLSPGSGGYRVFTDWDDDDTIPHSAPMGPPFHFAHIAHRYGDEEYLEAVLTGEYRYWQTAHHHNNAHHNTTASTVDQLGDDAPITLQFFIHACAEADTDTSRIVSYRLARQFIETQGDRFAELALEACPFNESTLDRHRGRLAGWILAEYDQRSASDRDPFLDSIVEWLLDHPHRLDTVADRCRERSCPDALTTRLRTEYASSKMAEVPRVFPADITVLQPTWRSGGPLSTPYGAAGSPDGQQLATLHGGERAVTGFFGEALDESELASFRHSSPPMIVIWDDTTATEVKRIELPIDRDDFFDTYSPRRDSTRLQWHGDYLSITTDEELVLVDHKTEEVKHVALDAHELGPAFSGDDTIATVSATYRRGPLTIQRRNIDDATQVNEREIWSSRSSTDWDVLLGDGTLVKDTDDGIYYERPDGTAAEVELSAVSVDMFKGGDAHRFVYAVADNVYAVDLQQGRIHTAFGACPVNAAGVKPTLSPEEYTDSPLGNCEESLGARRIFDGETAITFAGSGFVDDELPWIPQFHDGRFAHHNVVNMGSGDILRTSCNDIEQTDSQIWSVGTEGPFGPRPRRHFGERAQACGSSRLCGPGFVEHVHGSTTNVPMAFGYHRDHDYAGPDETILVWGDFHNPGWERIGFGRRGELTSLRYDANNHRLVTSALTPLNSVSVLHPDTGTTEWVVPEFFAADAALSDDGSALVTSGPAEGTHSNGFLPARWSIDNAIIEGCATATDYVAGDVENSAGFQLPDVQIIEYDREVLDLDIPDDEIEEMIEARIDEAMADRGDDDDFDTILDTIHGGDDEDIEADIEQAVRQQIEERRRRYSNFPDQWLIVAVDDRWLLSPGQDEGGESWHSLRRADACKDAGIAAIADIDNEIYIRNVDDGGTLIERIGVDADYRVTSLAFEPGDCRLAIGLKATADDLSSQVAVAELDEAGNWRLTAHIDLYTEASPTAIDWNLRDEVAVATDDFNVQIVSVAAGTTQILLEGLTRRATALAFSPDGTRVAAGSADGQTVMWTRRTDEDADDGSTEPR